MDYREQIQLVTIVLILIGVFLAVVLGAIGAG